jgi:putative phosphoribosyl transferase
MRFANRKDAGRRLADHLASRPFERPVVIGLPRGGVPVAAEIAQRLHAPLDVLVVRKLGSPWQPDVGLGVIAEGGVQLLDEPVVASLGITSEQLDGITALEEQELERRVRYYRADRSALPVSGRTIILVDDGLATGFTAHAGIEVLRRKGARLIVLAVPVGPADAVKQLRTQADRVICLRTPMFSSGVGAWYADYWPVSDATVAELLTAQAAIHPGVR